MALLRQRGAPENQLAGLRVVLPRTPDRAAGMAAELRRRGASASVMPLIDFERTDNPGELDESLTLLAQHKVDWLVITSITTVRALKACALDRGTSLAALVGDTKVAAVGTPSAKALEAEGLSVDLVPSGSMDAVGLVDAWPLPPEGGSRSTERMMVLLPQADIAAPTVFEGLMAKGWQVLPVTAYRTVDYPARPELRLTAVLEVTSLERADGLELITVADFRSRALDGGVDAVILTSPSVTRRLSGLLDPWPSGVRLIAIGASSARQAAELGLEIAGTAAEPTPSGIADALAQSLGHQPIETEGTP